jgi:hypothetical protein
VTFRSPLASSLLMAKLAALTSDSVRKAVRQIPRLKLDQYGQPFPYWDDGEVERLVFIFGEAMQLAANMVREDTIAQMMARRRLRKAPKAIATEDPKHLEDATTKPM